MSDKMRELLIGKRLRSVSLSGDKQLITFVEEDGTSHLFRAEGECCSQSWIEHLELPEPVDGVCVTAVDDSGCVDRKDLPDHLLQVYSTTVRTNRGDIAIEYRNSSNGYYGGYLEFERTDRPGEDGR